LDFLLGMSIKGHSYHFTSIRVIHKDFLSDCEEKKKDALRNEKLKEYDTHFISSAERHTFVFLLRVCKIQKTNQPIVGVILLLYAYALVYSC